MPLTTTDYEKLTKDALINMLLDYDGDKLKFKGKRPTVPKLFHPKSFETLSQFKIGNAIAFLDLEAVSEGHQTSVLLSFLDPEIVKHLSVVFGEDKLLKTEYCDVEEYLSSTYVNRESTLGKAFKLLSFDRGDDTFPLWHAKIVGQVKSFKSAFDQEVSVLVVLKMIMHEYSDEIQREIYKYIETKPQVLLQDLFSYIDTFMKVSTTGAINEVRAVYKKKYKKKKNKVKFRGDFSRRKVDELSCRDDVTSIVNVGSLSLNKDNSFYSIYINNVCVVFKVDTGADISVINPETFSKLRNVKLIKSNLTGRACNGNAVTFSGFFYAYLFHKKTKIFVGQVVRNLLGGDAAWSAIREVMLNSVDALGDDLELRNIILAKYPMLVSENLSKGISTFVADVSLKKDIQPIYIPARKVPVGYESLVRDLLQEWVRDGIIEKYHGVPRWASPIMLARENGRKPRLCVDFSASVNKCVEPLSYGIPDLPSLLNDLYQAEWYTHLDLKSAFLQVPISRRLQDIMVLSTQHGHYQFKKLPFGYINAPLIMQKIMEICLSDAMEDGKSFVKIYFDDVLIYGKSRDEIIRRTNVVCSLLENHGFTLNMSKSRFAVQEILFLGWSIAKGVRKPHDDRIESIVSLREPQSVSEVRQILGLISHYSSCIPKLHKYLHVFSDLCQKNSKFYWDEVLSSHFNEIKSLIATQTKTYLFNPTWTSVLSTDASSKAIGGVLEQICPSTGIHYPVWHFCKKLTKCQVNWSMTEKEAYSLIVGLRKFSYFLLGRKFLVNVDHSALLFLFGSHKGISAVTSGRIQRWLWEAQRFQFDISFIGTKEFSKADILTRLYNEESTLESEMIVAEIVSEEPEIFSLCPQLSKDEIISESQKDPTFIEIINLINNNWKSDHDIGKHLQWYFRNRKFIAYSNSMLLFKGRIMIPDSMRTQVLSLLHNHHQSVTHMYAAFKKQLYFKGFIHEAQEFWKQCEHCQEARKKPPRTFDTWKAKEPRKYIHGDVIYFRDKNFLMLLDSYSRFTCIYKLSDISSKQISAKLDEFILTYGMVENFCFDSGTQLVSKEIVDNYPVIIIPPNAQHANGACESMVKEFKNFATKNSTLSLTALINAFLYQIRFESSTPDQATPAERFFNTVFSPSLVKCNDAPGTPTRKFHVDDIVRIFFKTGKKWRKAKIIEKVGRFCYRVRLLDSSNGEKEILRHVNEIVS